MMWVSFALAALKTVLTILTWARERELISTGYDKALFEVSKDVLATTTQGKQMLEKVNALSPTELDDLSDAIGNANNPNKSKS